MPSAFENMPMTASTRNPRGILSMAMQSRKRMFEQQQNANATVLGSNNAGGLAPFSAPNPGSSGANKFGSMAQTGGSNNSMFSNQTVSFAAGGMLAPDGAAIRPGAGMQPEVQLGASAPEPVGGAGIEQEAQRFVQQHPEEAQKIQQVISVAIDSGELTSEELNMMVQLAKTALANPGSYSQVRQFAIQNGLGTEAEIPPQIDEGMLYTLIVAGKAMQSGAPQGGGNAMQGQAPAPTGVVPEYKEGGMTGDKPHMAKLHPREYVVPEDALIYHGKKHFDKLVEQARTPPDAKTN